MECVSAAEEAEETRVELVERRKASDAEPKVAVPVGGTPSSGERLWASRGSAQAARKAATGEGEWARSGGHVNGAAMKLFEALPRRSSERLDALTDARSYR